MNEVKNTSIRYVSARRDNYFNSIQQTHTKVNSKTCDAKMCRRKFANGYGIKLFNKFYSASRSSIGYWESKMAPFQQIYEKEAIWSQLLPSIELSYQLKEYFSKLNNALYHSTTVPLTPRKTHDS